MTPLLFSFDYICSSAAIVFCFDLQIEMVIICKKDIFFQLKIGLVKFFFDNYMRLCDGVTKAYLFLLAKKNILLKVGRF